MKNIDFLQEIFDGVKIESAPDPDAKQRAKERMLAYAAGSEGAVLTQNSGIQMKRGGKTQRTRGGMAKSKSWLKLNKSHLQGAAAAVLVAFGISVLAPVLTQAPPAELQGSLYTTTNSEQQEISVTVEPSQINAEEVTNGVTLTVSGLPDDALTAVKPENILLAGFLSSYTIESINTDSSGALTINAIPRENYDSQNTSKNGVIIISSDAFGDNYYYGEVSVI